MLTLTRYVNGVIYIDHKGERLELHVNRIQKSGDQKSTGQVSLGFVAPQSFVITRAELDSKGGEQSPQP